MSRLTDYLDACFQFTEEELETLRQLRESGGGTMSAPALLEEPVVEEAVEAVAPGAVDVHDILFIPEIAISAPITIAAGPERMSYEDLLAISDEERLPTQNSLRYIDMRGYDGFTGAHLGGHRLHTFKGKGQVFGPGVFGNLPQLKPGATFSILRPYEQDSYVVEKAMAVIIEQKDERRALADAYLKDRENHWLILSTCWGEHPKLWDLMRLYEETGGDPPQAASWWVFARFTGTHRLGYNPRTLEAAPEIQASIDEYNAQRAVAEAEGVIENG